jgi:hypothetical protein
MCDRVHHVVWYTKAQLLEMEANGRYGVAAGGEPISRLDDETGPAAEVARTAATCSSRPAPKDMIRVVECWIERGKRVVSIAGSDTLIEDRANPYWFDYLDHRFPFVTCSGMPDPFRIAGISEVELMDELQTMLWTLMNTRLDATLLLSNPMFMVADDIEDPEEISKIGPGEVKLVPRPVEESFKQWTPDPQVPQMTIQSESLVRSDLMDIVGGLPSEVAGSVSARLSRRPRRGFRSSSAGAEAAGGEEAAVRVGEGPDRRAVVCAEPAVREGGASRPGDRAEGAQDWIAVRPEEIQGVYAFETEMVDDSMIRQERRAEQQAKLQVCAQIAPVSARRWGSRSTSRPNIEDYLGHVRHLRQGAVLSARRIRIR